MPFGRSRATSCDVQPRCVCLKGLSQGFVSSLLFGFFCRSHDFVFHLCSLSWWRASLPSSLGSMGRTKDRASKMSQESSNDALLEVIAQLRQQNQVLLDRLASQQSVNGSVMVQARHTPATISDAPSVHPAADSARGDSEGPGAPHTSHEFFCLNGSSCRRLCLENQESQIRTCERHLRQSYHPGWMVCSRCSFIRGIPAGRHGYLSCHTKRGRRGDARVALGKWTCYSHDKADRSWVGRDRIRSQNISEPVHNGEALLGAAGRRSGHTYKCSAPRGGAVEADTSLVVIGFHKKHRHPDAWKTATTRPKSATAYWLNKLGAEPVDFLPPRSGGIDGVEVVTRFHKDNFEKVLRGSGEFGVFSRPFFVKDDTRVYKDCPTPQSTLTSRRL